MSDENQKEQAKFQRRIRSFVRREGKLTTGQERALHEVWPEVGVPLADTKVTDEEVPAKQIEGHAELIDFNELFGREAPLVVEIGFGNGLSLADMAEQAPELNFFGIEVHRPGVGSLLVQIKQRQLGNIRVSQSDAVEVLKRQIPDGSVSRLQIFFPDPWHKKRHHKRRLINSEFVALATKKLASGGVLHVATDWENYAEHILDVLQISELVNTADGYAEKPEYRPGTKYEARGLRFGHNVFDLVFKKE